MRPRSVQGLTRRDLPDGESVVLGADADRAVVLNALGGFVFELCDGRLRAGDIAKLIGERWQDVSAERIESDVNRFIAELQAAGMIEDLDACGSDPSEH